MEYRILGRLEASAGGRSFDLGGLRQRRVLVALLLNAGRVVPVADPVEAAWDDDPAATAERQVRNRVAELRSILTRRGGLIGTMDSGYRLRLDGAFLDLACYQPALTLARECGDRHNEATTLAYLGDTHHAGGNPTGARDAWQQSLAILDDLDHPDAHTVRAELATLDSD